MEAQLKKIEKAIALMNGIIQCSEGHSKQSWQVLEDARMAIKELSIYEWIDRNDRLPEVGENVLCSLTEASMGGPHFIGLRVGMLNKSGSRFSCEFDWIHVTHWMPLPNKP